MAENDEDATQWCWILSTALRASYGWKDMNNQEHKKDVANEREVEYFYRPGSCKLMSSLLFYRSLSRHGPLHVPKYKLIYQKKLKTDLITIFWSFDIPSDFESLIYILINGVKCMKINTDWTIFKIYKRNFRGTNYSVKGSPVLGDRNTGILVLCTILV